MRVQRQPHEGVGSRHLRNRTSRQTPARGASSLRPDWRRAVSRHHRRSGGRRLRKPAQAATKLVIIDELIVVAGSTNYTGPANLYNDENIFVTGSTREEVSGVEVEVTDRKIGGFFKAEIERIIGFCEPYDPAA